MITAHDTFGGQFLLSVKHKLGIMQMPDLMILNSYFVALFHLPDENKKFS